MNFKRTLMAGVLSFGMLLWGLGGLTQAGAGNGNGAPSGPHYNLNLIGFANGQNYTQDNSGGNVIHVPLYGNCTIDLTEGSFAVLDSNCTGGNNALFQLPAPDPTNSGTSAYSVFVATRGKPLGTATMQSCYIDSSGTQYCSTYLLPLKRNFGPSKFDNVTKYLLYVYACVSGTVTRVPLFSDSTEQYYWQYDNYGLRNAALRFYPGVQTIVPSGGSSC